MKKIFQIALGVLLVAIIVGLIVATWMPAIVQSRMAATSPAH